MRKSFFLCLTACLSALLFMTPSASAEFKVATVDVGRLMNESKDALGKRKEIEKKSSELQKKFEEKRKNLQATEEKIKSGEITEGSKEASEFKASARELGREFDDARADMQSEVMKLNKVIGEKVIKAISEYSKANNLDLVLDKSERGRGPVLFGQESFDITDEIMKKLE